MNSATIRAALTGSISQMSDVSRTIGAESCCGARDRRRALRRDRRRPPPPTAELPTVTGTQLATATGAEPRAAGDPVELIAPRAGSSPLRGDAAGRQRALQDRLEGLAAQRLGDVLVHSGGQALLAVAVHRVRGDGDDRRVAVGGLQAPDLAGRRIAVQLGQAAVHEDRLVALAQAHLHGLPARLGEVDCVAALLEDVDRHHLVDLVVLGEQDPRSTVAQDFRRCRGRLARPRLERRNRVTTRLAGTREGAHPGRRRVIRHPLCGRMRRGSA